MPRIFLIKPRTKQKKIKNSSNEDETENLSSNMNVSSKINGNEAVERVEEMEDKQVANDDKITSNNFKMRQRSLDSFLSTSSGEIIPSDTSSLPGMNFAIT